MCVYPINNMAEIWQYTINNMAVNENKIKQYNLSSLAVSGSVRGTIG